ncbi:vanadium-dependent haloperoxidase [Nonlabens xiamenensis]|uniref:vanadium-dependent haloperoxidase n=1 Tax=Nonlabens xiamenensis TaxID=2341043 RepID=UPI000F608191|nr:vanadium-dependent haloperoxidase [Nonlabens xiamenensis]
MNKILTFLFLLLSLTSCKDSSQETDQNTSITTDQNIKKGVDNRAYQWGAIALEATARDTERFKPRPTITSRFLGLIFTAVFDAWSRYDHKAMPVYLEGVPRRPAEEFTEAQKEVAISYAAFKAMCEYYPADSTYFAEQMKKMGLDPSDKNMDPTTPAGIGNLAAKAVIDARRNDGSNQYGNQSSTPGEAYFDYTNYQPVNNVDNNTDINRWQPKYFDDGQGGKFAPSCLTPFWQHVEPIALQSADQFRPGPPPMIGSDQLKEEVKEVVELQQNLSDEQKALVEFMRDGPQSVQQAGHWLKFAQDVSRRDQHTLDQDVSMYFYNQIVAMDAFIASWDAKMHYDFARPFALVHHYYGGKTITGWAGEGQGFKKMDGNQWRPYSPATFLCPPFPSYVSGHSTISGGCAEALKLWTGSDEFGESVTLTAGALTDPYELGETVTLHFPTFTQTAEMAGKSRVLGGYHIEADNVAGLKLGRDVAHEAWSFYKKHMGIN